MRKILVLLMFIPMVGFSFTGNDLWPKCSVLENFLNGKAIYNANTAGEVGYCEGVIDAVNQEVFADWKYFSPNVTRCYQSSPVLQNVNFYQMEAVFIKYLRENPQSRNQPIENIMGDMLRTKFPIPESCKNLDVSQPIASSGEKLEPSLSEKVKGALRKLSS